MCRTRCVEKGKDFPGDGRQACKAAGVCLATRHVDIMQRRCWGWDVDRRPKIAARGFNKVVSEVYLTYDRSRKEMRYTSGQEVNGMEIVAQVAMYCRGQRGPRLDYYRGFL